MTPVVRDRRWWLLAGAATTVVVLVAAASLTRASDPPAVETASFANQPGGYRFDYPVGWTATAMGTTTKISSPERDVVVGVGRAPGGAPARASRSFTRAVLRAYRDVRVGGSTEQRLGGRDALVFAGTAVNITDVRVRWLTLTIPQGRRSLGVSVFTDADSDPQRLLPLLHTLVGSIRSTRA